MAELTTEQLTAELPKTVFMVVMYYPPPRDRVGPVIIPFPPVGYGLPVFGDREGVEEFVASPSFDIPGYTIKEITLEQLIAGGEVPIDIAREHDPDSWYFYMVDPRPWHEWESVEDMGFLIPMRDAAEILREALDESKA